jgi:hypothetical protein
MAVPQIAAAPISMIVPRIGTLRSAAPMVRSKKVPIAWKRLLRKL